MSPYLPDLAAQAVPRYTSYPTAAEFTAAAGAAAQAEALAGLDGTSALSLYVHIPFCHSICLYCGCNTGAIGKPARVDAYADVLAREAAQVGAMAAGRVTAVHFGGGSPNALSPQRLLQISGQLRRAFAMAPDAQWAVELDPHHLAPEQMRALAGAGFQRASLGVQSFAPHVQRAIGRIQPFDSVSAAVEGLRAVGIDRISLDLMYGLPQQSLADMEETLRLALILRPDRLSVFGYAHLPSALPRQRAIDAATLPDAELRFRQNALAQALLVEAGYRAIGFDHYALPEDSLAKAAAAGRLNRNFQGYTDDSAAVTLGLGASAISQFPGLIVQNEKNPAAYARSIAATGLAGARGVRVEAEDRHRARLIRTLLCTGHVDLGEAALPGWLKAYWLTQLGRFVQRGLLRLEGQAAVLTPDGWPYARLVAAVFDAYRDPAAARFSRAV